MNGKPTQRQQFLAAITEIKDVYENASGPIGYDGRRRVRAAHAALWELGASIPDTPPGPLPLTGGMSDKDLARARRHAENGLSSPAGTLALISEILVLREQLHAIGGLHGVTEEDIRSMIGEGFHTAFRKAVDSPESVVIHKLIKDMDPQEWSAIVSFVSGPVIAALREAEQHADNTEQEIIS